MATRTAARKARSASASKPVAVKRSTTRPVAKPVVKAPAPPAFESEVRVSAADYKDAVGIDVRTWRRIKGEWIPGKGIRFAAEDAAAIIEGIQALAGE